MPDGLLLGAALLLGLMGSSHCLAMCGGISAALGAASGGSAPALALAYNLGRVLCYAALGAVAGGAVQLGVGALGGWLPLLGPWLRTLAGLLVVAMGLYVAGWWLGLTRLEALGGRLWRRVQPLTRALLPPRNTGSALALGALWGLLPCGLVYSSLSWAAARGDALESAMLMAGFGVGTLPAMLATTLGGQQLQQRLRQPALRRFAGALLIAFGTVTALMPWWHGAGHAHGGAAGNDAPPHHQHH